MIIKKGGVGGGRILHLSSSAAQAWAMEATSARLPGATCRAEAALHPPRDCHCLAFPVHPALSSGKPGHPKGKVTFKNKIIKYCATSKPRSMTAKT